MLMELVIFAKNCNYKILESFYSKNLWIYIEKLVEFCKVKKVLRHVKKW